MLESIQYQQLNDEAKAYLRAVREGSGRGAPGVYVARGSKRPTFAFLFGLAILFFLFMQSYVAPKEPLATAMLQTAGLLLGGWLIVYAFRRWTAGPDVYGKFYYFDPEHAYIAEGETLRLAYLGDSPEVEPFGQSQVRFATEKGQFAVTVPSRFVAQLVADYYQALTWVRSRTEGKWVDLPPAEAGAVAKYLAEMDEEPGGVNDTDLTITELPNEAIAARRPKSGAMGLLLILVIGAAAFGGFYMLNEKMEPMRDDWAYQDAVEANNATKYRDYLRNEKHSLHRAEAETKLAALYTTPISSVTTRATDKELKEGMVKLLESVKGPKSPNVSLRVKQLFPRNGNSSVEQTALRTRFGDGIAVELAGTNKDLISFGNAPDNKHAHIDMSYEESESGLVNWTVQIRLSPTDEKPIAEKKGTWTPNPFDRFQTTQEAIYVDIMRRMIGNAPAPPLPPVEDFD